MKKYMAIAMLISSIIKCAGQPFFTVSNHTLKKDNLIQGGFITNNNEFVFACDSGIFSYENFLIFILLIIFFLVY